MANAFIGSEYTITDVTQCNTASDTNVWYKVTFNYADDYTSSEVDDEGNPISYDNVDPLVYCTTINDEKFPKDLTKVHFISNVTSELDSYVSVMSVTTQDDLTDWKTED